MMLGSCYVDVGSPRQVIGMTDRQMDGQLFSFIYVDSRYAINMNSFY